MSKESGGKATLVRPQVRKSIAILGIEITLPLSPATKRRICGIVLALLVAVGMAYWKRAAVRRFGNEWNAARHLQKAEEALAAGEARAAVGRAVTSLGLEPGRIEALRVLLAASRVAADPKALIAGMSLHSHPEASDEDRIAGLAVLNDVGDAIRFASLFGRLPEGAKALPSARYEWLRHLLVRGEAREADRLLEVERSSLREARFALLHLDALSRIDGPGAGVRWHRTALGLLDGGEAADRDAAWTRIAQRDPGRIAPEEAQAYASRLTAVPPGPGVPATLPHHLRLAADPARRNHHLGQAVEELRGDHLDDLCRWLASLNEHGPLLEAVDEIQAHRSDIAYQARARALIGTGRLEDAFAFLQFPPLSADRMGLLTLRASVAGRLGRRADAVTTWQEALVEAGRDLAGNRYLNLARFAERNGEREIAAEALVAACRHPQGILPPSEELRWLMAHLIERDRPAELLTVTRRLLRAEAESVELLNNALYLTIVLDDHRQQGGDVLARVAESLRREHPDSDAMCTTLALVHLAAAQPTEALGLFRPDERDGPGRERLGDAGRSILAMALLANGLEDEAAEVVGTVRWDRLLGAERRFYRERLRSLLPEEVPPPKAAASALP